MSAPSMRVVLCWAWVAGALAGYLAGFRPLLNPLLARLGLS